MNCLVGQSGGPTSVINSSLSGVIQAAFDNDFRIFGCKNGIEGLLTNDIVEFNKEKFENANGKERLKKRPSSILGSCRFRLPDDMEDEVYVKIFNQLKKYKISIFVYIGGNDSMDTVLKLNKYMQYKGINWINICGSPKTIDNDLMLMDHSPGFGSAAKFIVNTIVDIRKDVDIYKKKTVTIVEIMGRNAGWLAASSLLANHNRRRKIVNLVYLSEMKINKEQIIEDIKKSHEKEDNLIIVISEGFVDAKNNFKREIERTYDEGFNHPIISGMSRRLSEYIYQQLDIKTKAVELSIVQRVNHLISKTDSEEAFNLGYKSLEIAKSTTNMVPVIIREESDTYMPKYEYIESEIIANKEKKVPKEWFETQETLERKIIEYALPLIKGEVIQDYEDGILQYISLGEIINMED